jgi:hypothetical protein
MRDIAVVILTSNFRKQWGLAQNHSETVAFMVTFFPLSKFEVPWCAKSGKETASRPAVIAKTLKSPPFMKAFGQIFSVDANAMARTLTGQAQTPRRCRLLFR